MKLQRIDITVEYFCDENNIEYRRDSSEDSTLVHWHYRNRDRSSQSFYVSDIDEQFFYISDPERNEQLENAFDRLTHEERLAERDE